MMATEIPQSSPDPLAWLLDGVPGVREALQQRIEENSDYRLWLQQNGPSLLQAVKNEDKGGR